MKPQYPISHNTPTCSNNIRARLPVFIWRKPRGNHAETTEHVEIGGAKVNGDHHPHGLPDPSPLTDLLVSEAIQP
jgi:hypothetical protein